MKLEINISEADFGHELKSILDSLSIEEKKEIAKEVMIKALNEVTDNQRTLAEKEAKVFQQIIDNLGSYNDEKNKFINSNIAEKRKHYKYNDLMKNVKSAKELAYEALAKEATATFQMEAKNLIQKDEKLKLYWEETAKEIRDNFPKFIHDAMSYYFASQLSSMQSGIQQAIMQSQNAASQLENINRRIGSNY